VGRVTKGFTFFNLLINNSEITLEILGVLLVKWCHTKLLVNQGLLLPSTGAVAVVGVVTELQVSLLTV